MTTPGKASKNTNLKFTFNFLDLLMAFRGRNTRSTLRHFKTSLPPSETSLEVLLAENKIILSRRFNHNPTEPSTISPVTRSSPSLAPANARKIHPLPIFAFLKLSFHIIADNRRVAEIVQPSDRRGWLTIAEIEHFLSQRLLTIAINYHLSFP